LAQIWGKCDSRDINYVLADQKCYRDISVLTKWCGKTMMHSELGYRLLRAEQVSLEKQIIWSLSRWRVYGDRDDFRRGMTCLDQLALLKSLDAMRDDRSFF
jgi:hypothetical protein